MVTKPFKEQTELPKTIQVSDLSPSTVEVLEYFGLEAPAKLNAYALELENALGDIAQAYKLIKQELEETKAKLSEYQIDNT